MRHFRASLFRHEQIILAQAQQSAACNATHTVEARLSRWLLRCHDLQGSDDLKLTQEFLGQMLGVRRTSVSLVAHTLQEAGLIRYSRGNIRILDLAGLKAAACECYETVKLHAERLTGASGAALVGRQRGRLQSHRACARFQTVCRVIPEGVRGLANFNSVALSDVTRRF